MFKQRAIIVLLVASIVLILAGYGAATPQKEVTTAPPTQITAASVPTTAPETDTATAPTAGEGQGEPITITKWDLWASDETTLRGINIYQRRVYPEWDGSDWMGPGPLGPPYVQEDFDEIAATGINYVNLSHPGLFSEKPPFTLDEGAQANLDQLLEKAAAADLFAVISVRTGPGRSEFTFMGVAPDDQWGQSQLNDTVWKDQASQDAWVEMWRYIAGRYKDNPVVVGYDLMVEPNSSAVFFDMYWPPDFYPAYAGTLYDWNQFYPRIVKAIREVDPDTPILVGAMSFSSVDWLPYLKPTDDPRTVYTVHPYAPHDYTHQEPDAQGNLPLTYPGSFDLNGDGATDSFDRAWLESALAPIGQYKSEHGVPVAANEYGAQRYEPGAAQYLDDVMSLFEKLGINYSPWSWSSAYWMQREEIKSFELRLGPDPNNRTKIVPNAMWDVLTSYWARNTLRPSKVNFVPAGVAAKPIITIASNKNSYSPGDTLTLSVSIDNPTSTTQVVDLFLGIIIPDGSAYFFDPSLANLILARSDDPKTFTAARTSLELNPGYNLPSTNFFTLTLPTGLPEGTYQAFAALAEPGSVQAGSPKVIGDISLAPFTFSR